MTALVHQLQQAALDKTGKVSDLLRFALVAARKLEIADFEKWIDQELTGYKKLADVPDYRTIRGTLRAYHPKFGWQDVGFQNSTAAAEFCIRPLSDPISQLEGFLANQTEHSVMSVVRAIDTARVYLEERGWRIC